MDIREVRAGRRVRLRPRRVRVMRGGRVRAIGRVYWVHQSWAVMVMVAMGGMIGRGGVQGVTIMCVVLFFSVIILFPGEGDF